MPWPHKIYIVVNLATKLFFLLQFQLVFILHLSKSLPSPGGYSRPKCRKYIAKLNILLIERRFFSSQFVTGCCAQESLQNRILGQLQARAVPDWIWRGMQDDLPTGAFPFMSDIRSDHRKPLEQGVRDLVKYIRQSCKMPYLLHRANLSNHFATLISDDRKASVRDDWKPLDQGVRDCVRARVQRQLRDGARDELQDWVGNPIL